MSVGEPHHPMPSAESPSSSPRIVRRLCHGWGFCYDPEAEANKARADVDASGDDFIPVTLPHTWQTYETTGEVHPFVRNPAERDNPHWWHGWGWYRKSFRLDARHRGRKVFVEFDAAQKLSRVYCNGQFLTEHAGGFASFSVDLTLVIRWDAPNVLCVAVSARQDDHAGGIPPMSAGNWSLYGGLYREARLVLTHEVYIPFQGAAEAEGGTLLTTPELSRERARVRMVTHLRNESSGPRSVSVTQIVRDDAGETVVRFTDSVLLPAGSAVPVTQESPVIPSPRLWSPEDPYCYAVHTAVSEGDACLDEWHTPLGFRWFRWDHAENALYLNDRRIRLTGMNRHQEYPWLGDAVPWWIHEQELHEIRYGLGVNFARWCHYPNDKRVYDWCDRHGIIVCEEVPCIKPLPFGEAHQRQQVREMIRRDRNHPSIIMWSMGNETDNGADGRWARAEDPSRLIHYRKVHGPTPEADHTHEQLDMENLLRCTVRGWWEPSAMDADTAPLPQDAESGQVTGSEAFQHAAARIQGGSVRGRVDEDTVVWIYADHGADREYRHSPLKHVNPKGWVDAYRQPKELYWLWKANRCEELMVHVRAYFWRPAMLGARRAIVVDSNAESVELFVGDRSLGVQFPTAGGFFSVEYTGVEVVAETLRAVARRGGETVEECVPMAGPASALRLRASHAALKAETDGVALVTVDVVDREGHAVIGARPILEWSVEGPGHLTAPSRWVSDINRRHSMDGTLYIITPVVMPVRASGEPGTLTVRVQSEGLEPAAVEIRIEARSAPADDGITEMEPRTGDGEWLARQRERGLELSATRDADLPMVYEDLILESDQPAAVRAQVRKLLLSVAGETMAETYLDTLTELALAGQGSLIADDINFYLSVWHTRVR